MTDYIFFIILKNIIKMKNEILMMDDLYLILLISCIKILFNLINIMTNHLFVIIENFINIKHKNSIICELIFMYLIIA